MKTSFGAEVQRTAEALRAQGRDANQIAKIVHDRDPEGYNYGIGIVVDGQGEAWPTSDTLLEYARTEIDNSLAGEYMSTGALSEALKASVLRWQRVPQEHWDRFSLLIPSDAGTGAVKTAVEMALQLYPDLRAIGVEALSWPAYAAIARMSRISCREFPIGDIMNEPDLLRVYQAGPMNTTGRVQALETVRNRAASAKGRPVLLDRAYSGFEYARLLDACGIRRDHDEKLQRPDPTLHRARRTLLGVRQSHQGLRHLRPSPRRAAPDAPARLVRRRRDLGARQHGGARPGFVL